MMQLLLHRFLNYGISLGWDAHILYATVRKFFKQSFNHNQKMRLLLHDVREPKKWNEPVRHVQYAFSASNAFIFGWLCDKSKIRTFLSAWKIVTFVSFNYRVSQQVLDSKQKLVEKFVKVCLHSSISRVCTSPFNLTNLFQNSNFAWILYFH